MKPDQSTLLIILILLLMMNCQTNSQDLKTQLETSLKNFTEAVRANDAVRFKSAICTSRYIALKNQVLSSGMDFPKGFLEGSRETLSEYFDLSKLTFQKAIGKDATAILIYTQAKPEPQVCVYKFVNEQGVWKYDWIDIVSDSEIRKKITANDYSFLDVGKFQPSGVVPETPQEIKAFGEYTGYVNVIADGYLVQTRINGNLQNVVNGGSYSGLIQGGIKKGKNTITIFITKKDGDQRPPSEVTISVTINAWVNGDTKEVYAIEEGDPRSEITEEFEVQ